MSAVRMVPGTCACVSGSYDKSLAAWDMAAGRPQLLGTLGSQPAPVLEVGPGCAGQSCACGRPV